MAGRCPKHQVRSVATVPGAAVSSTGEPCPVQRKVSTIYVPPRNLEGKVDAAGADGLCRALAGCIITASGCGRRCHIITRAGVGVDALSGDSPRPGRNWEEPLIRCSVEFERDVEAVALTLLTMAASSRDDAERTASSLRRRETFEGGNCEEEGAEFSSSASSSYSSSVDSAVLFVSTRDGRLWRSLDGHDDDDGRRGVAFARGTARARRYIQDGTGQSGGDDNLDGERSMDALSMSECRIGDGPLFSPGADILAVRMERVDSESGKSLGSALVVAGSASLYPPMVVWVPASYPSVIGQRSRKRPRLSKVDPYIKGKAHFKAYGEKIYSLENVCTRISSVLFVSKRLMGISWNGLVQVYGQCSGCIDDEFGILDADSAVLIGYENGVIRCAPVSIFSAHANGEECTSVRVGTALPIGRFSRPQAVSLLLLSSSGSEGPHRICCVGSLGYLSILSKTKAGGTHSFCSIRPGLPRVGMWTSSAAHFDPFLRSKFNFTRSSAGKKKHEGPRGAHAHSYTFVSTCDNGSAYSCTISTRCSPSCEMVGCSSCVQAFDSMPVKMPIRAEMSSVALCIFNPRDSSRCIPILVFTTFRGALAIMEVLDQNQSSPWITSAGLGVARKRSTRETVGSGLLRSAIFLKESRANCKRREHIEQSDDERFKATRDLISQLRRVLKGGDIKLKGQFGRKVRNRIDIDASVRELRMSSRAVSAINAMAQCSLKDECWSIRSFFHTGGENQKKPSQKFASSGAFASLGEKVVMRCPAVSLEDCRSWVHSCHVLQSIKSPSSPCSNPPSLRDFLLVSCCMRNSTFGVKRVAYGGTAFTNSKASGKSKLFNDDLVINVDRWDRHSLNASMSASRVFNTADAPWIRSFLLRSKQSKIVRSRRNEEFPSNLIPFEAAVSRVYNQNGRQRRIRDAKKQSLGIVIPVPVTCSRSSDAIWDIFECVVNRGTRISASVYRERGATAEVLLSSFRSLHACRPLAHEVEEMLIQTHSHFTGGHNTGLMGWQTESVQSTVLVSPTVHNVVFKRLIGSGVALNVAGLLVSAIICDGSEEPNKKVPAKREAPEGVKMLGLAVGGKHVTENDLSWNLALLRSSILLHVLAHGDHLERSASMVEAADALELYQSSLKGVMTGKKIRYLARAVQGLAKEKADNSLHLSLLPCLYSLLRMYRQLRSLGLPLP